MRRLFLNPIIKEVFSVYSKGNYFPIRLRFFNGKSWISKLIKWGTRGRFSHVGFELTDDVLVEAWEDTSKHNKIKSIIGIFGAKWQLTSSNFHTPGTPYETLELPVSYDTYIEYLKLLDFVVSINVPYDWGEIIRFIIRKPELKQNGKFVCSTGCCYFLQYLGILDKNIPYWRQSPQDLYDLLLARGFNKVYQGET